MRVQFLSRLDDIKARAFRAYLEAQGLTLQRWFEQHVDADIKLDPAAAVEPTDDIKAPLERPITSRELFASVGLDWEAL